MRRAIDEAVEERLLSALVGEAGAGTGMNRESFRSLYRCAGGAVLWTGRAVVWRGAVEAGSLCLTLPKCLSRPSARSEGELDDRLVDIEVPPSAPRVVGPFGAEGANLQARCWASRLAGWQGSRRC